MDFELSDEQRQLADSLGRLLQDRYDFEARARRLATPAGVDDAMWQQLAELGVLALPLSEQAGGFAGGAVDLMQPMALLGRALAVEPVNAQLTAGVLLDTLTAAAGPLDPAVKAILEACANGGQRLAWAHDDASRDTGADDPVRLVDGRLSGTKVGVEGADRADWLLVTITPDPRAASAGPAVYLLPAGHDGIAIRSCRLLDNRQAADITFRATPVKGAGGAEGASSAGGAGGAGGVSSAGSVGLVGAAGEPTRQAIKAALDFSSALLCAEAMGLIDFACETTLDYLKTRKQFGVPIGSFQALQHRIVDLYVELEQVRSMTALACSRVDAARTGQVDAVERGRAVAAARVYIARATRKVAQESVQLHGGMGMAEEMKISHAFRRLTLLGRQGGHESRHLDRFIELGREQAAAHARPVEARTKTEPARA